MAIRFFLILSLLLFQTLISTPLFAESSKPVKEEQAVYNQTVILPEELRNVPEDTDLFSQIKDVIASIFSVLFQTPTFKEKFYSQSNRLQQVSVPDEIRSEGKPSANILNRILGSEGSYGSTLPEFEGQKESTVKEYEQAYEQANFPEGVNPIVPEATSPARQ